MANPRSNFMLKQNILPRHTGGITVTPTHEDHLSLATLKDFLASVVDESIGLAPTYDELERLSAIAFASHNRVLIVKMTYNCRFAAQNRQLLSSSILLNASYRKYAFHMDKLSTSLFRDYSLRIREAVDILSLSRQPRHLLLTIIDALGGEWKVDKPSVKHLFRHEESSKADRSVVATQAWAAYQAVLIQSTSAVPNIIDTTIFSAEELNFLARSISDAERLKALKPTAIKNDVEEKTVISSDHLNVQSTRFKTRIMRPGSNQILQVEMTRDGRTSNFAARLSHISGRMAQLDISSAARTEKLAVYTIGREDPTAAESLRTSILLKTIQNIDSFSPSTAPNPIPVIFDRRPLNDSQRTAVKAILSDEPSKRLVVIQGPPGTGKTTVIAATVLSIMSTRGSDHNIWLVAQSNVAVKNIAEKLDDVGFFDFKLLVSKDFHFDWHEHFYMKIAMNVIPSDDFVDFTLAAEGLLMGSRVILCTLSMLANDRITVFSRLVPPTLFIFDEASQIEVGDYIPMLHRYHGTMRKLVFIGDDKQLPPYGQSGVENLQSVFEMPHLRRRALFLDTQYRMPAPIASVISQHVYNGRLKTVHKVNAKTCCRFVDVSNGREAFRGRSWINEEEARVAAALARKLEALRCSYRIITPYDAQRTLIENSLKTEKLI
ncbi:Regulator of nonsense transcripts 1 [Leucoagaricus sp. SymC.cos]|nr:Regulator of nonsense transcripts 1 [Leucoagaricus sp. SymC.cos]